MEGEAAAPVAEESNRQQATMYTSPRAGRRETPEIEAGIEVRSGRRMSAALQRGVGAAARAGKPVLLLANCEQHVTFGAVCDSV